MVQRAATITAKKTPPITSDDATVVEFLLKTDHNIYLDLQSLELKIDQQEKMTAV